MRATIDAGDPTLLIGGTDHVRLNGVRRFVHTGVVWSVELQEVSPRPGRTTVALGLRAIWAA